MSDSDMVKKNNMEYCYAIKMRMFPNHTQKQILWKNINTARFIYNQLLANSYIDSRIIKNKLDKLYPIPESKWKYRTRIINGKKKQIVIAKSKKRPIGLDRITPKKYPWLNDTDLDSMMFFNTEIHYKAAWNMFRKVNTTGKPKFKRKSRPVQSYSTSAIRQQGASLFNKSSIRFLDGKHIQLPKVGKIKVKLSRSLPNNNAVITTVTVKHYPDNTWYVSLVLRSNNPFVKKLPLVTNPIGIDLNLTKFIVDSNGKTIDNPQYYRKSEKHLANLQHKLAIKYRRAKKDKRNLHDCKNYQKLRQKIAKLQKHITNQRLNFTHNLSITLIKNHDLVIAENLQSKNMLKNHALAMHISDAGWRTFLTQMEYKAKLYGKTFIEIDPKYTTQRCHACGHIKKGKEHISLAGNKQYQTDHYTYICYNSTCPLYKQVQNRDVNAAKNILDKGYLALCGHIALKTRIWR